MRPRRYIYLYCRIWLITFLSFISSASVHTTSSNPESGSVGLTLSGGGARGFAHIGVLHVIDSLGLKVDYISGTSMGAIIGALYATGYNAKEIEDIVLSVDWEGVFGNKPDLDYVHIGKRRISGRFVAELPIVDNRLKFETGLVEGQRMWSVLQDLFFHVRGINWYNEFPIPFACVAANIETGEAVILNKGDIVNALRASVAIPAVFTAVERDGMTLLDGGVVNNLPVDVVKEMGADFVIGINVSQGLKQAENLKSPIEVIYQMGLFQAEQMLRVNKEQTDIFIEPDLDGFTSNSFSDVNEIIERGKQIARSYCSDLDSIAMARREIWKSIKQPHVQRIRSIVVDSVSYNGLENIRFYFIRNMTHIQPGDTIGVDEINILINRLYATDYFERVTYSYIPSVKEPGKAHLVFNFSEKPSIKINAAIHYNLFAGVGIIGGILMNNFLFHNMDAFARLSLGEQPAFLTGLNFFTGSNQRIWIRSQASGDMIIFPVYENFEVVSEYKESYIRLESSINQSAGEHSFFTLGSAFFKQELTPTMINGLHAKGHKQGYEMFAKWSRYSLNRHSYTRKGQNLATEITWFLGQDHSISVLADDGSSHDLTELNIIINNFFRMKLNWESFIPVNQRITYFTQLQAGYNFRYFQDFIHAFNLGGTHSFLRDQITFTGLNEFGIITSSVITAGMGLNYNLWSEFYLVPVLNAAFYNFEIQNLNKLQSGQLLLGAGLSFGYLSLIGPVKVSFSYSPQTGNVLACLNLGWSL